MKDRIDTLKKISGLPVSTYKKGNNNYFVFGETNRPVKTVCTYPKAKLFAEGMALGRKLSNQKGTIGIDFSETPIKTMELFEGIVEGRALGE